MSIDVFGNVHVMDVRQRKLVGKRDGFHVAFESLGAFVVQDLQYWFESAIGNVLVVFCEGSGKIAFAAVLDGFRKNFVQIVVVENHDVLGAAAGGVREAIGLVAEKLAGDGHCFGKHNIRSDIGIWRDERRCHDV